jgi:Chaperone of endosialidase
MYKYTNNAAGTFPNAISAITTTLQLQSGQGALFPAITGSDVFRATITDTATKTFIEIVTCTAISGDTLTVIRAQEGTTARSWLAGDILSHRETAAQMQDMLSQTYGGAVIAPVSVTANPGSGSVLTVVSTGAAPALAVTGAVGITGNTAITGTAAITGATTIASSLTTGTALTVAALPAITINSPGTSINFNTTSDYRCKNSIRPMQKALDKIHNLFPYTFKYNGSPEVHQGFLAHELQEVVPQAVTGEKDGDEYQVVDYSKLIPLLTAAIKELAYKVKILEMVINS